MLSRWSVWTWQSMSLKSHSSSLAQRPAKATFELTGVGGQSRPGVVPFSGQYAVSGEQGGFHRRSDALARLGVGEASRVTDQQHVAAVMPVPAAHRAELAETVAAFSEVLKEMGPIAGKRQGRKT